MIMKHRTTVLGIAIVTFVLVSTGAVACVNAAKPATVGGPITGGPSVATDGNMNLFYVAQGVPNPFGSNIYFMAVNPMGEGTWSSAIGTGTNPCIVWQGGTNLSIFAVGTNGALWDKQTTDDGVTWKVVTLPATSVYAGTGPAAVFAPTPFQPEGIGQTDVFYVNSASQNLMWLSLPASGNNMLQSLGGKVFATPAAAVTSFLGGSNSITVVVKGTGGRIYDRLYTSGGFDVWGKAWHDGLIGPGASLASDGVEDLALFVVGTNDRMYAAYSTDDGASWLTINGATGSGSTHSLYWATLGGATASPPAAVLYYSEYYYSPLQPTYYDYAVVVRGGDGNLWQQTPSVNAVVPTVGGPFSVPSPWYGPISGP